MDEFRLVVGGTPHCREDSFDNLGEGNNVHMGGRWGDEEDLSCIRVMVLLAGETPGRFLSVQF